VLPAPHVERVLRDYYAGKLGDADLEDRLLRNVDENHFRSICQNALQGLAAKKLRRIGLSRSTSSSFSTSSGSTAA
jgi:hypothetical protein